SEDDPAIQELWARLIANATDQNGNHSMRRAYITILTSIDRPEAKVLEELRKSMNRNEEADVSALSASVDDLAKATELPNDTVEDAMYHLAGLGCFRMTGTATSLVIDKGSATADQWPTVRGADARFTMTRLAYSLLQACSP
ncbi:MAG: Abi-alpha family protein, partial [Limnospira sp. PMC 1238.20]|uniref:Abi-alpha family protein n=1 Tax=Limnospira sp. PMC 1238.20 TaxID=2981036 RepID=UPI0028E0AD8C